MNRANRRLGRWLLAAALCIAAPPRSDAAESDAALIQAAQAVAAGQASPLQKSMVLKNQARIQALAYNGKLGGTPQANNAAYQASQKVIDSGVRDALGRTAKETGLEIELPERGKDAAPGTDNDPQIRTKDGKPLTYEQWKAANDAYQRNVRQVIREGGGAPEGSVDSGADLLPDPDNTSPENFKRITSDINNQGGTAYDSPEAARAQKALSSNGKQPMTIEQGKAFVDNMQNLANQKFQTADMLDAHARQIKATDPGRAAQLEGQAQICRSQGAKYIQRIDGAANTLAKQNGIPVPETGEGKESPFDKITKDAANKRGQGTSTEAAEVGAMGEHLVSKSTMNYIETMAKIAKADPSKAAACEASIAQAMQKLPPAQQGQAIELVRTTTGSAEAAGRVSQQAKTIRAETVIGEGGLTRAGQAKINKVNEVAKKVGPWMLIYDAAGRLKRVYKADDPSYQAGKELAGFTGGVAGGAAGAYAGAGVGAWIGAQYGAVGGVPGVVIGGMIGGLVGGIGGYMAGDHLATPLGDTNSSWWEKNNPDTYFDAQARQKYLDPNKDIFGQLLEAGFTPEEAAKAAVAYAHGSLAEFNASLKGARDKMLKEWKDRPVRRFSDMATNEVQQLLDCLCSASLGANPWVAQGYNTNIPPGADPKRHSCGSLANGPCMAQGFGCWRSFIRWGNPGISDCLASFNLPTNDCDTFRALDAYNRKVEKPMRVKVVADRTTIQVGESVVVHAEISGGRPPYDCYWFAHARNPYSSWDYENIAMGPSVRVWTNIPGQGAQQIMYVANTYEFKGGAPGTFEIRARVISSFFSNPNLPYDFSRCLGQLSPDYSDLYHAPISPVSDAAVITVVPAEKPPPPVAPPHAPPPPVKPKKPVTKTSSGGGSSGGTSDSGVGTTSGGGVKPPAIPPAKGPQKTGGGSAGGDSGPATQAPGGGKGGGGGAASSGGAGGGPDKGSAPHPPGGTPPPGQAISPDCAACLNISVDHQASASSLTLPGDQVATDAQGSATYSVQGCPNQTVKISVKGSDGWSGSAEGQNKPASVTRPVGAASGVDEVTVENLAIPGCKQTFQSEFGPGPAAAATNLDTCAVLSGGASGQATSLTDAGGQTTGSSEASSWYRVEGPAGTQVKITVTGSDGWSGSAEGAGATTVTHPFAVGVSGTDSIVYENLSIPGCRKTAEIPFGIPDDLRGAEATSAAGAAAAAGPTGVLDGYVGTTAGKAEQNTASGLAVMSDNQGLQDASNVGNQTLDGAKRTVDSAGYAAQDIASKSQQKIKTEDSKDANILGEAILNGVGSGLQQAGQQFGAGMGSHVAGEIFDSHASKSSGGGSGSEAKAGGSGAPSAGGSGGGSGSSGGGSGSSGSGGGSGSSGYGGGSDGQILADALCPVCGQMYNPADGHQCPGAGGGGEIMADALCPVCGQMYNPAVGHQCPGASQGTSETACDICGKTPASSVSTVDGGTKNMCNACQGYHRCPQCGKYAMEFHSTGYGYEVTNADGSTSSRSGSIEGVCQECIDRWRREHDLP